MSKATPEEMADLQRALVLHLTKELQKPDPATEKLITARRLLKDMLYVPDITAKLLKRLDGLQAAYLEGLESVMAGSPTPSALKEVREFVRQSERELRNHRAVNPASIPSGPLQS